MTTPAPLGSSALLLAAEFFFDYKLWKTDGTPAGTTLVKDFTPTAPPTTAGSCRCWGHGFPERGRAIGHDRLLALGRHHGRHAFASHRSRPSEGAALDGALILSVFSELWRSDGWPQGTALLSPDPSDVLCLKASERPRVLHGAHRLQRAASCG